MERTALQDTTAVEAVSPEAAVLACTILGGEVSVDAAIDLAAHFLMKDERVDVVACSLTSLAPDVTTSWMHLGARAWVREWSRPAIPLSILPPPGAGPEAALTMPWLSQFARRDIVALTDRELLPVDAARDREELGRVGARSLIATTFSGDGMMFGSMSAGSVQAGQWSSTLVGDFRLINASITSRLWAEHSRRALAESIATSTEARQAHQQFFASVGHELRTPLAAVVGYTEVLIDDAKHAPSDQVAESLTQDGPRILKACDQLVSVVDNLLGAGRTLASGDTREDVVVAEAIADVFHWHLTPARTARITMDSSVEGDVTVWAHPSGVRQMLTNLVNNAVVHNRQGGSVHVSTARLLGESGTPMVRIIVRDDGPGLTSEQMERVFEPFARFTTGTRGSGLGLPLSRTIAERDAGSVRGESTPGKGSSFWLELPAEQPPTT